MVSHDLVLSSNARRIHSEAPQSGSSVDSRYVSAGLQLASLLYLGSSCLPLLRMLGIGFKTLRWSRELMSNAPFPSNIVSTGAWV